MIRFLIAQLHLESLIGKRSPKAVRTALKSLHKECKVGDNLKALDVAYEHAMERIESQIGDQNVLAKQVLQWITCTRRPLTTTELRHALAVEIEDSELDDENLPEIDDLLSACCGLVTVDKQSDIIRLVHHTAQEYFERTHTIWFPNAQTDIAETCVTYLSFDAFEGGYCVTDEAFNERQRLNPLYGYAAQNWGHHARESSTTGQSSIRLRKLIIDLLENAAKSSACSQALLPLKAYTWYSRGVPKVKTGQHLAAYFGLKDILMTLLETGCNADSRDYYGRTPLSWAAESGQCEVVKMLLANSRVDPDSKDSDYRQTALSWAAASGHEAIVKLLLANGRVDSNSRDYFHQTPLLLAAQRGHEAVVKLLLENDGVDPDSEDCDGQTPLLLAAESGHEAVVKLLLANGRVNPNTKAEHGWTPLSLAVGRGHEEVVKLLLGDSRVNPNTKTNYGSTPLLLAAWRGHEVVVKLLLADNRVNPNTKSDFG